MRDPIVIVGAGASAVHAAQTALEAGRSVVMLDVGKPAPPAALPGASLNELKTKLADPVSYFLGEDYSALILPDSSDEYYGIPPSKSHVFAPAPGTDFTADGFSPLFSYAQGGLGQAWTAGSYPFSGGELAAFPFGWEAMGPAYSEVARRIGISGVTDDDLSAFMPAHDGIMPPIAMDEHSNQLLAKWNKRRDRIIAKRNMYLGRARIASLSKDHAGRPGCTLCGRCLWACPTDSIYTPRVTLDLIRRHPQFTYISGVRVDRFEYGDGGVVTRIVATKLDGGAEISVDAGTLVLAAGALGSARVLLQSLHHAGERVELGGLMDNRQILMPFVNLSRIGAKFDDRSYQYNQLAVGAPGETPFDYVHGLMTTLTTALIHPVAQTLPISMQAATGLFRNIHGALGLMNINFADTRREENRVGLEVDADGHQRMLIHYTPPKGEAEKLKASVSAFRGFLMDMGCVAPPPMTRPRPMGASVHYAGLTPMKAEGGDYTTRRDGRLRPFSNLVMADGATFSSLPAKNLTFTLMANATRIMHEALAV